MPNYCRFEMRVVGNAEDINEFIQDALDLDRPRHFWRVFELDECGDKENDDGTVTRDFMGNCAWSVYSCMLDGEHTYAHDHPERSATLLTESKDRNLSIEVYSFEPGLCFSEHYLVRNGKMEANEEVEYCEYYYFEDEYDSFEDFKEEVELPDDITEEDFKYDELVSVGGHEVIWHI